MKPTKTLKTKKDFLNFFKQIPTKQWGKGSLHKHGRSCALGHLGVRDSDSTFDENGNTNLDYEQVWEKTPNGKAFRKLGGNADSLMYANDFGFADKKGKTKNTIKDNVLAYIKSL